MTDRELNEAVARKLGHGQYETLCPGYTGIIDTKTGKERRVWPPADYCTSIEAAWEIVESRKDYRRDIIILGSFERDGYCCRLADMIDGKLVVTEGHGDTAPRAICEAFLKMEDGI